MAQFRVGDRVRFTGEGEVAQVIEDEGNEFIRLRGWSTVLDISPGNNRYTVEKITRHLPTTPLSIVRLRNGRVAAKHAQIDGRWDYLDGTTGWDHERVIAQNFRGDVIFDAGKDA